MIPDGQVLNSGHDKIDIIAISRVLWKYKYLIVLTTAFFGAVALFLAFTAIPVYRAEAAITEVTDGNIGNAASLANQIGGLASLVGMNLSGSGGAGRESQALLKSRRLAEEFVVRHELIPLLFKNSTEPPTLWMAVRKFKEGVLTIRDDKRTGLTIVSVNWTDPTVAARWANEYVALANEELRERAISDSMASIAYLNRQVALTNVVEVQRVMYNLVESQTKTLMLANARAEYGFSVVDPAVPPEVRISPRRRLMVILGLALGGLIGLAFSFVHNLWQQYRSELPSLA